MRHVPCHTLLTALVVTLVAATLGVTDASVKGVLVLGVAVHHEDVTGITEVTEAVGLDEREMVEGIAEPVERTDEKAGVYVEAGLDSVD